MFAYIAKRLGLLIPTLFGIILLNFLLIQLAPGGPVEQMISKLEGASLSEAGSGIKPQDYKAAQGLPKELIDELKVQYGFDKPLWERFWLLLKSYIVFDLGESYYRKAPVWEIICEKLPVSISLGVFSTLLIYLISIPLGIYNAYRNGSRFDSVSSFIIVVCNAVPPFLFGVVGIVLLASAWQVFPLRGLVGEDFASLSTFGKVLDYLHHITLPVLCLSLGSLAWLTFLTKHSFIDELHKPYVLCARAKGVSEARILYGYIFRNAMLLVIASFPSAFLGMFLSGSLMIEMLFSLDGLGLLGYESLLSRDYPVVFGSLYIFTLLALVFGIISDITYTLIDPRIHFDTR